MELDTSFVRIGADWTAQAALQVLGAFPHVTSVIVQRVEPPAEYFYAYPYKTVVDRLKARIGAKVIEALDLHEYTATPTIPADGADPTARAVVLDRGVIVGIATPGGDGGLRGDAPIGRGVGGLAPESIVPVDQIRPEDHHGDEDAGPAATPRGLAAVAPSQIARGATKTVMVKLLASGVAGGAATVAVASGDKLSIVLEAADAIELVGDTEGTFDVTGNDELALAFQIRGRALGFGRITFHAFKGTSRVAWFSISIQVVDVAPAVTPPPIDRRVEMRAPERPPDLEIDIYEDKHEHTYTIELNAADSNLGLNRRRFAPIQLGDDIDAYFTKLYSEIEKTLSSTDSPADKIATLGQKGAHLFERIVPEDVRLELWRLRDQITSIQIQSEEPWVPWELCRLSGKDDTGTIIDGPFISERYAVTRWFLGMPRFTTLTMHSIGLVVPHDSGLAAASAEETAVTNLATAAPGCTVANIDCHPIELRKQLASGTYDALHFAGHGAYAPDDADRSSIKLADGTRFYPEDLAGSVANLGRKRPVVFLNACEVGRAGTTLGGLGGWPQAFVRAGAAAFIGPFWKIGDASSAQFAGAFYSALVAGKTVGEAVHAARAEIRKASDPTWLAYVVYAHPDAKLG